MGVVTKCACMFGLIAVANLNIVQFPKIGFTCQDPTISYKFNGDTVTMGYLFGVTLTSPLILMGLVEYLESRTAGIVKRVGRWYGQYAFGLLMLIVVIETAKSIVSEPRPHFLDTCRPDAAVNCTSGYVREYKCSNSNATPYALKDCVRSFPSGHSAIGFYLFVFLIMFLQARTNSKLLLVPGMQLLSMVWAVFCALSRITDRRHHWWDVLIGSICGLCLGVYVVQRLCSGFNSHVKSEECSSENSVSSGKVSTRRLLSSTSSYLPSDDKDARAMS